MYLYWYNEGTTEFRLYIHDSFITGDEIVFFICLIDQYIDFGEMGEKKTLKISRLHFSRISHMK